MYIIVGVVTVIFRRVVDELSQGLIDHLLYLHVFVQHVCLMGC